VTTSGAKDTFALNLNQELEHMLWQTRNRKVRFLAQHQIVNQTYMYSLQLISLLER